MQKLADGKRLQFRLVHLLVATAVIGGLLSLVIQLNAHGIATAILATIGIVSCLFRKWNVTVAAAFTLVYFSITMLSGWVAYGRLGTMQSRGFYDYDNMARIAHSIKTFAVEKGHLPVDLAALPQNQSTIDSWSNSYFYSPGKESFQLASLGRDGKRGGEGLDADMFYGDKEAWKETRLPFRQYLSESNGSAAVFGFPLGVGYCLFIALIFALNLNKFTGTGTPTPKSLLVSAAVVTLCSTVITVVLLSFHIMSQQSGH